QIAQQRGIRIDDFALRDLNERTDGWAAGLVLSLERDRKPEEGIPAAGATPQAVFDYFSGEIFDRMDGQERSALVQYSLIPVMAVHRVAELSDYADAGALLDRFARANYFTLKLATKGGAHGTYQFHPLFREFLQRRAEEHFAERELAELRI